MSKKIVVTGGSGRFGMVLKSIKTKHKVFFPNKSELNILNYKNITNYIKIGQLVAGQKHFENQSHHF